MVLNLHQHQHQYQHLVVLKQTYKDIVHVEEKVMGSVVKELIVKKIQ